MAKEGQKAQEKKGKASRAKGRGFLEINILSRAPGGLARPRKLKQQADRRGIEWPCPEGTVSPLEVLPRAQMDGEGKGRPASHCLQKLLRFSREEKPKPPALDHGAHGLSVPTPRNSPSLQWLSGRKRVSQHRESIHWSVQDFGLWSQCLWHVILKVSARGGKKRNQGCCAGQHRLVEVIRGNRRTSEKRSQSICSALTEQQSPLYLSNRFYARLISLLTPAFIWAFSPACWEA